MRNKLKIYKKVLSGICLLILLVAIFFVASLFYSEYISKPVFIMAALALLALVIILIKNNMNYLLLKASIYKCTKCGHKIRQEDFCPSCGEKPMELDDRKMFSVMNILLWFLIPITAIIWLDLLLRVIMWFVSPAANNWIGIFGVMINIY